MDKGRMKELVEKLNEYSLAYYSSAAPKVSDAEYDALFDELLSLESESGTVLADSPTKRVGAEPIKEFAEHRHIARLWSLDKVRSMEALSEWGAKAVRFSAEYPGGALAECEFSLEYKFDGLTVNLTYEGGELTSAATRGNGVVGEDILAQVRTIRTVPLTIPFKGRMEVQGEGYMRLSILDALNKSGDEQLKNARNAAAGALRNLDPKVTARRRLDIALYSIGFIEGKTLKNNREALAFLRENGLPVSEYAHFSKDISAFADEIERVERERGKLDFLIDGMVVKVSDFAAREAMGATDRFPRWAMAYKFTAEETTTTVLDVTWEVGRTGKLTPRAYLESVELAGATISHATLNNYDDIQRKRVGIGSRVFIRRSNDVIPEILSAVPDDVPEKPVEKPERCPACGAHVEHRGVHLYCTNSLSCPPQIAARLAHYASRDAMDIAGFSEQTAALLVETMGLRSIPDLYDLTAADFMALEGFKEKRTNNLLNAITESKQRPLGAFVFAIGIPNVGAKTARDLARHFGSLEALRRASRDELLTIDEVGEVVADGILEFFSDAAIAAQIDRLLAHGVEPVSEAVPSAASPIAGMTVVVTGTMERMGRSEIEALIESLGGKAASSVSKKTSMVVAGPGAGSKLDKARALGIKVMDENELFELIGDIR